MDYTSNRKNPPPESNLEPSDPQDTTTAATEMTSLAYEPVPTFEQEWQQRGTSLRNDDAVMRLVVVLSLIAASMRCVKCAK